MAGIDLSGPADDDWEDASSRGSVERTPTSDNDAMAVLGLILLVLVTVLVLAIFVSNPDVYDLSIFGAVVKVTSAGIFITGAITMAVTILALLLVRTGIRRGRARRKQLKELETSDAAAAGTSTTPAETSATTIMTDISSTPLTSKPAEPEAAKERSSLDLGGESSTTAAERQALLDEADALTRDEPEK
jgi:flagellar biosynthesis/type III secretory pathway M-ring protein FliF/YscJ